MKSFSSVLAWLLLAAVLSVPSFLFYNWWSKSSKQSSAEVAPGPVTVNVFPADEGSRPAAAQPPAAQRQPVQAAKQPDAQPAPAAQAEPRQEPAPAAKQPAPVAAQAAEPAAAAEQPADTQDAVTPPAQEAQAVAGSTAPAVLSYYEPKGDRDPTLSPEDYRRIKEARRQREEAERMRQAAERNKPREPGPETFIALQGIVGNAAIINGDMVSVGQTVRGVKVVKIGADYIIGEHKGKRFKKVLK